MALLHKIELECHYYSQKVFFVVEVLKKKIWRFDW
ncbi:hypothetical protein VEx25_B0215 [Vibrio antiquarius]|uniref:Uncharacterized protein n=1 Tax=Vibrio antiquarius (strain Ex25) TaxID=150340 RepID=A0ABM9WXI8_VIBAE|nr:hypothetical protein VEx25_B0215 [Vibrio antiquarius]